jgi:dihydroorotase
MELNWSALRFDKIAQGTRWTIDPTKFVSKSRNTPFGGWEVRGRAHTVIVSGEVRFTRGGIVQQAGAAVSV